MADFYTYRKEVNRRRRWNRAMVFLVILLVIACGFVGMYWFRRSGQEQPVQAETPAAEQTPETAAEPVPTAAPVTEGPRRLLPEVEESSWNTSVPVEPALDQEYRSTDARMVALPAGTRVSDSYFDTVTFVGDSIASGLGIYNTGITNAQYCTYVSASANSFGNNASMKNAVTGVTETPLEAVPATQPDAIYILVGTNNLVTQGNESGFLAYYEKMIDMLRERLTPGVEIYIQSIPGVQETVVQSKPGLDNARIETVNNMLANLALRKGCHYLNIAEVLNEADGRQMDAYTTKDGIHFNASGYAAWREYLYDHTAYSARTIYDGQNPYKIFGK